MAIEPTKVSLSYLPGNFGRLAVVTDDISAPIWSRLNLAVVSRGLDAEVSNTSIQVPWPDLLNLVREFGSRDIQASVGFRFKPEGEAIPRLQAFATEIRGARASRIEITPLKSIEAIEAELEALGFDFSRRKLKPFQLRDISHLLSLPNGANFSVPGAGKTTVTFALHLLTRKPGQHLFVVAPKAAFKAWRDIVDECMLPDSPPGYREQFTMLDGDEDHTAQALSSGATRFVMSYDLLIRQQSVIAAHFARTPVHLVVDEAHRMKAGLQSQRGAFLLNIATLPIRRDILTGTPMPQGAPDIQSQLDFLWPGHGLGIQVAQGSSPREVLGNLYVRTTKKELGLPEVKRHFLDVKMKPGQLALY